MAMHDDLDRNECPRHDRSTYSNHAAGDPRQIAVKASGHPLERVTHYTYLPHDKAVTFDLRIRYRRRYTVAKASG
jgi:hypothetical protein